MRKETDQPINREKLKSLYQKHLALAKAAEEKGDRVLSEGHYQRAEYYLHAMKKAGASVLATPTRPSARQSHSAKKEIRGFRLRGLRKEPSDTWEKPAQEANVSPFRGHYLRRNRRGIQDKETSE